MQRWRRRKGLAALVIVSLVLGIGLNTAVFTLLDSAFLSPWPIDELEPLAMVHVTRRNAAGEPAGRYRHAYLDLQDLRQRQKSFADLAAFHWWPMSLAGGAEPVRTKGMYVTSSYFDLLGLEPTVGRFFTREDDAEGSPGDVVVLAHGTWRRLFGADPDVVGKTVRVNGEPMTVVGVAPRGFVGTELPNSIDFWIPITAFPRISPGAFFWTQRGSSVFNLIGRLRPGISREQASVELDGLARQIEDEYPKLNEGLGYDVAPLLEAGYRPGERERLWGYGRHLLYGALLVLLVTAVDVTGLLLVHTLERRPEIALRQSLGASRRQLLAELGVEHFVLLILGGLFAIPSARLILDILWRLRPPQLDAELYDLSLDLRALGVAFGLTLLVGTVVSLLSLWRGGKAHPATALRGIRQLAGGTRGARWRDPLRWLVVLQIALAMTAMVAAGRLSYEERRARAIEPGFDAERLAVVSMAPGEAGWNRDRIEGFLDRLTEEASALPGVSRVAISENRLLRGGVYQRQLFLGGDDEPLIIGERIAHRTNAVRPGFFATVGIPFVAGSDFDPLLSPESERLVIVNRTLAETVWPGENAIGKTLHFDFSDTEPLYVVGVVEDARYRNLREPRQFFLYLPMAQEPRDSMTLHLRVESGDPAAVLPSIRRLLRELAPELPLSDVQPLTAFIEEDLWLDRASARLMTLFTLLAWSLAALGLYGAMSRMVTRRRRELGIRRSLGAGPWQAMAPLAREAIELLLLAGLLSTPVFVALTRAAPEALATVLPWLIVIPITCVVACWWPCRRALAVAPADVLREE